MADQMTPAQADQILNAVKVLEQLERDGKITSSEQEALDRYRKKQRPAEDVALETAARYQGFKSGAMMALDDEIAGARAAVSDFVKSRDTKSASEAYYKYRDLLRQKDEAAQLISPEAYAKGEMAGAFSGAMAPAGGAAKVTQGMGALGKIVSGALTGAAMASLPSYGRGTEGPIADIGNIDPRTAITGAAIGGSSPMLGAAAGYGARALQDVARFGRALPDMTGRASRRVARSIGAAERSGQDIEKYLAEIGPEGMIADIPGSPRQTAQGMAAIGGTGADIVRREIETRAAGAGQRISGEMDARIAGPTAAFEARAEQARRKASVFGPMYDAAKQFPDPINVDALRSGITIAARDQSGPVRAALGSVLKDIGQEGEISALRLHNARAALSDAKEEAFAAKSGEKGKILKNVLEEVDQRLDQIPGYAQARSGWADASSIERSIDQGREVFSGGPMSAMSPQELEVKLSGMSDAQKEAFKKGSREYIAALMGTSRNDAPAAWGAFDKSWNAEKLRLILGDQDASAIMRRLKAEAEFSKTRSEVLAGSQTEFRKQAAADLSSAREMGAESAPTITERLNKTLSAPVNRVVDELLFGTARSTLNRDIGRILSLQGAERDAAVNVLLRGARNMQDKTRAQQIIEQLFSAGALSTVPVVTE